ncbi:MAG: tetratricopeptide repeat protein, partial [Phycisphaerales bacterium]
MSKKPPATESNASDAQGGADIDALLTQAQASKKSASKRAPAKEGSVSARRLWQGPVLVLGAALFVGGVVAAFATKPDFDTEGAMARAEVHVEEGRGADALVELNGKLLDKLGVSEAPKELRERFHRARAGAMYLEMRAKGLQSEENYRRVLDELAVLEGLGVELDAAEIARSIEARLALGENDTAIELVNRIDPEDAERRRRMLKLVIRAALDDLEETAEGASPERFEQTLALLTKLASDPTLDDRDRVWTIARQAELRLAAGYNSEAVAHLLREMQRVDNLRGEEAGELFVLLGRAYFNLGQFTEAAQRLSEADTTLSPTDERRATANVLLGRIAMMRGDAELARERFAFVTTSFGSAEDVDEAWLGLAEAEAQLGNFDKAAEAYGVLVESLLREHGEGAHTVAVGTASRTQHAEPAGGHTGAHAAAPAHGPEPDLPLGTRVVRSLQHLAEARLDRDDPAGTVRFARIAERLAGDGKETARWSALLQAQAHRIQADSLASAAAPDGDAARLDEADPVTLREIKTRYLAAADEYRRHALAVIGSDDEAYGRSLWNAADSADLAGDHARAIKWFGEFVNGRPLDARRDSARFRIAMAHQAGGDLAPAINLYRDLIASNPS